MSGSRHTVHQPMSRRQMLGTCRSGFGSLAFVSLFGGLGAACQKVEKLSLLQSDIRHKPSLHSESQACYLSVYGWWCLSGRFL